MSRRRLLILCYHGVSETWDDNLAVRPAALEAQVRMAIRRGYVPTSAQELLGRTGKLLHVTFDDAFQNIRSAVLTLISQKVPVTVFACPGLADEGRPLDVERLVGSGYENERKTMTWDDLRELLALGVEIGSHTTTHPRLTRLSDAELRDELCGSKEWLERELGRPCTVLAYPFGDHDARVRAAARDAGYTAAFALPGRYEPVDPFALPRVGPQRSDSTLKATLKLSGLRQPAAAYRESRRERAVLAASAPPAQGE